MEAKHTQTVWNLWRCERGAQWSSVKGSILCDEPYDKNPCNFSGCSPESHSVTLVKTSSDREETAQWFTRPKQD